MKNPRQDKADAQLKKLIFTLKKKYKFPFSDAHIKDVVNCYSEEYDAKVREDIAFAKTVTDSICVAVKDRDELVLYNKSMQACFDNYINEKKIQ